MLFDGATLVPSVSRIKVRRFKFGRCFGLYDTVSLPDRYRRANCAATALQRIPRDIIGIGLPRKDCLPVR